MMGYFFKSVLSNPPPEVEPSPTETVDWETEKYLFTLECYSFFQN